jgi:CRISPR-associated protein Cmr6
VKRLWEGLDDEARSRSHPVYSMARLVMWGSEKDKLKARKDAALRAGLAAVTHQDRRALAQRALGRRRSWVEPLEQAGLARRLQLTAVTDAVLWLASAGPLEVGLALHHVYGFPVLPGSALKGVALRAARGAQTPDVVEARYGAQEHAGSVAFLDALPCDGWAVQRDVMTPHFQKWYAGGERAPDDTDDPVPVGFVSVKAGTAFETALLARSPALATHLAGVVADLVRGLDALGLGAKTAAGYGAFRVGELPVPPVVAAEVGPGPSPEQRQAAGRADEASLSPQGSAVQARIRALRVQDRGQVDDVARAIAHCPASEREGLWASLVEKLRGLGWRQRDLQAFVERHQGRGPSS